MYEPSHGKIYNVAYMYYNSKEDDVERVSACAKDPQILIALSETMPLMPRIEISYVLRIRVD